MKRGPKIVAPEQRFWRFVKKTSTCWLWTGFIMEHGYGKFGNGDGHTKVQAHRFAYEMYHGRIPVEEKVLHTCDVRHCVRKEHLYTGTNKKNTKDMMDRGRNRHDGAGHKKLSRGQRRKLMALTLKGASIRSLSKMFAVSKSTVKYWKLKALVS